MDRLALALQLTLQFEGEFSDHPADPGGATMWGVTQRVYSAWLSSQGMPNRHVRDMKEWEREAIYRTRYWNPSRADQLLPPVDLVHFDTAVNCGVGRAKRLLQAAAGTHVDGDWGPKTQSALDAADPLWLTDALLWERENHYRKLVGKRPDLGVFLRGWLWRLEELRWAAQVGLPGRGQWLQAA